MTLCSSRGAKGGVAGGRRGGGALDQAAAAAARQPCSSGRWRTAVSGARTQPRLTPAALRAVVARGQKYGTGTIIVEIPSTRSSTYVYIPVLHVPAGTIL